MFMIRMPSTAIPRVVSSMPMRSPRSVGTGVLLIGHPGGASPDGNHCTQLPELRRAARAFFPQRRAAGGRAMATIRYPQGSDAARQYEQMTWRAAGAQFYPGGAYDALQERSH